MNKQKKQNMEDYLPYFTKSLKRYINGKRVLTVAKRLVVPQNIDVGHVCIK